MWRWRCNDTRKKNFNLDTNTKRIPTVHLSTISSTLWYLHYTSSQINQFFHIITTNYFEARVAFKNPNWPIPGTNLQLFPKSGNGLGPGTLLYGRASSHSLLKTCSRTSSTSAVSVDAWRRRDANAVLIAARRTVLDNIPEPGLTRTTMAKIANAHRTRNDNKTEQKLALSPSTRLLFRGVCGNFAKNPERVYGEVQKV